VTKTPAILSLLHQDVVPASLTRIFREQSVLRWTLARLSQCDALSQVSVLCWANQFPALRGFENVIAVPGVDLPSMRAISRTHGAGPTAGGEVCSQPPALTWDFTGHRCWRR